MNHTWTVIGSVISAFLLLGSVLTMVDPDIHINGVTIVLYLALCAGIVWLGRRVDTWRQTHR